MNMLVNREQNNYEQAERKRKDSEVIDHKITTQYPRKNYDIDQRPFGSGRLNRLSMSNLGGSGDNYHC